VTSLPNGVRLRICGAAVKEPDFERDFHYDHSAEGCCELRMDECSLENGVLLLVLRRQPPRRMKLRRAPGKTTSLISVPEDGANQQHGNPALELSVETPPRACANEPEFHLLTPGACAPQTPGSCSAASEVPSELWLCPPRSACSRGEKEREMVTQPMPPRLRPLDPQEAPEATLAASASLS
jgi:hypothetical protein